MTVSSEREWNVEFHPHFKRYYLYVPIGKASDGNPLTFATPLIGAEATFWQRGEIDALIRLLRGRGIVLPSPLRLREGKFKKFVRALRKRFFGGSN